MARPVREIVLGSSGHQGVHARVSRGHPWVWRSSIDRGLEGATPGEYVQVLTGNGEAIGCGVADPMSQIAVRLWTRGCTPMGSELLDERVGRAIALRAALSGSNTTAYRLVHGEGDRMPGLVVDRYDSVAVMRTDGEAAAAHAEDFAQALWPRVSRDGVSTLVHRIGTKGQEPRLEVLRGDPPPCSIHVREYGVPFVVDLAQGQKTGAFLDQRDNRRRVGELARGRRVLNLFSYAGGFSTPRRDRRRIPCDERGHSSARPRDGPGELPPGRGGPRDRPRELRDRRSPRVSRRGPRTTRSLDLIVSDPPSFAPSEKALPRALAAYRALHRACVEVLAPGGILCAASCSSHVDASTFMHTLDDAALCGRELTVVELHGAGSDHPARPPFRRDGT